MKNILLILLLPLSIVATAQTKKVVVVGTRGGSTPITLTTTGTSGASTLVGSALNIPNYATGGGAAIDTTSLSNRINIKQNQSRYYGSIYRANSWASLSSFTNNGASVSIVSNKINFAGNSTGNTYTISEDYDYYTCMNKWMVKAKIKAVSKSATSYGFGIGIRSYASQQKQDMIATFDQSNGAASGKIKIIGFSNVYLKDTVAALSSTALTWSANDYIELSIERIDDTVKVYARNVTTSSSPISVLYKLSPSIPLTILEPNTGKFGVFDLNATANSFILDSLNISSKSLINSDITFIGDSKAFYGASDFTKTFPYYLRGDILSLNINAGAGDRTTEVVNRLPEIISLKPKQALVCIGYNDIGSGVSTAIWQSNIDTIYNRLTRNNITVTFLNSIYDNYTGAGWSATLASYINATYPTSFIDTYNAGLVQSNSVSADNIHPSDTGHLVVYNTVLESNKILANYPVNDIVRRGLPNSYDSIKRVGLQVQGRKNGLFFPLYTDSIGGGSDFSTILRSTGFASVPSSGAGIELLYNAGAVVQGYDRTALAYTPLRLDGSALNLNTITNGQVNFGSGNVNIGSGNFSLNGTSATSRFSVTGNETNRNNAEFGTFGIQSYATNNGWLSDNAYFDGANFRYRANGTANLLYFTGGGLNLLRAASGTAGAVATFTTQQRWYGNGNIEAAVYADYADNATAIAAGLTVGMFYKTGDLVKQVH